MSEQAEKAQEVSSGVALSGGRGGIFGIKSGMTQIYDKEGNCVPVTVIDLVPNVVTQVKRMDRDGYLAVQVGVSPRKAQNVSRAEKGHFKASGNPGYKFVRELRTTNIDGLKEGVLLSASFLKDGDLVDVEGVSKGKGFQGVMKRHQFAGGAASHGASVCHRAPGSIGNRADPARVFPGKKMAGHMGAERVTVQNVEVISVDTQNGVLLLRGSVPGAKLGLITVKKAAKVAG